MAIRIRLYARFFACAAAVFAVTCTIATTTALLLGFSIFSHSVFS
jgi:hypothetical protein